MATVLFAWELGANLGHLIPMARIAASLAGDHHRIIFALRDLTHARAVLGPEARVLQAPMWPIHRHFGAMSGAIASYTDILATVGFVDAEKLAAVATAWHSLIDMVQPDLVVADHSPGLLFALHGRDTTTVAIGTCFTMPPLDYDQFPPVRSDHAPAIPEQRFLESVREVAMQMGVRRPQRLVDVFQTQHRVVFGLPELDPYRSFRREPVVAPPGGLPAAQPWPRSERLFFYGGGHDSEFDILLQALATVDRPVEAYLRGDMAQAREFLRMRGMTVHETPPPLEAVLGTASHVLTQGGAGTVAAAYAAGRPQLVAAPHEEADVNADLLIQAGVGKRLTVGEKPAKVAADIVAFLDDPVLPDNALEAANRIARRPLPDGAAVAAETIRAALR
jgi:hypothetical protein